MNSSCWSNCEPSTHTALGGRAANEYRVRSLSNSLESSFVGSTLSPLPHHSQATSSTYYHQDFALLGLAVGHRLRFLYFVIIEGMLDGLRWPRLVSLFCVFAFLLFLLSNTIRFLRTLFIFLFQFFLCLLSLFLIFPLLSPAGNMLSRGMQALFAGLFLEAITADTLPSCCLIRQSINAGGR